MTRRSAGSILGKASASLKQLELHANDSLTSDRRFVPMKSMKTNEVFMTDTVQRNRFDCREAAYQAPTSIIINGRAPNAGRVIPLA